jgi:hypothetical protein
MDLTGERSQKITPRHLRRHAYLYVRQSTLRQVVENTESTERQYALRQRAVALGWPIEQVVVIAGCVRTRRPTGPTDDGVPHVRDPRSFKGSQCAGSAGIG